MINLAIWCLMWNAWFCNPLIIVVTIKTSSPIIEIILKYSFSRKFERKIAMPLIMLTVLPNLSFELNSFIEAKTISKAYKVTITFTIIENSMIYFSFLFLNRQITSLIRTSPESLVLLYQKNIKTTPITCPIDNRGCFNSVV